jgi:nucleotide-binding universal stress UspA family protein
MKRIVVGLDGTPKDECVARWVADLADDLGAHIIAVHVVPRPTLWMIAGAQVDSATYVAELREHFEATTLVALRRADPSLVFHLAIGDPAHELARIAWRCDADLVAVGASSHTQMHDVVFGGLERRLVHVTEIPVVAIPRRVRSVHLVDSEQRLRR